MKLEAKKKTLNTGNEARQRRRRRRKIGDVLPQNSIVVRRSVTLKATKKKVLEEDGAIRLSRAVLGRVDVKAAGIY